MTNNDKNLDHLADLLNGIPLDREGMTIAEFDGYVAGLLVCPEMIMPSEWLPVVWGDEGTGAFRDIEQVEKITEAVVGHYNRVARVLATDPDLYEPIFGVDPNSDDLLWGPWTGGFERAMRLRVKSWERVIESDDDDAMSSLSMIIAMNRIDQGTSELTDVNIDEFDRIAPDLIPQIVRTLNAWRKSRHVRGTLGSDGSLPGLPTNVRPFRGRKIGRNKYCPCGSGRKYKRCCGAH